jgi:hypothetical protein
MSVGVAMMYLVGQLNTAKELSKKIKKFVELSRTNKSINALQISYYEKAAGLKRWFVDTLRYVASDLLFKRNVGASKLRGVH